MKIDQVTYSVEESQAGSCLISLGTEDNGKSFMLTVTKSNYASMRNMSLEAKRFFCTEEHFSIKRDEAETFLKKCEQISIVAVPNALIGADGTTFSLSIRCGFNQATYSWWCDLPEEWKALDVITRTLVQWASIGL